MKNPSKKCFLCGRNTYQIFETVCNHCEHKFKNLIEYGSDKEKEQLNTLLEDYDWETLLKEGRI